MPKIAVVIRHLPEHRSVTSVVIEEDSDDSIDCMDSYLKSTAEEYITKFKETFPEFKKANFYIDIVTL